MQFMKEDGLKTSEAAKENLLGMMALETPMRDNLKTIKCMDRALSSGVKIRITSGNGLATRNRVKV